MVFYNAHFVPVLSSGAQVWGPDFINVDFARAMTPLVGEHHAYTRSVVGARNPTMVSICCELSQRLHQFHWANPILRC